MADRLFDIGIFSGLQRPDPGKGMPVIRSRGRHHVDIPLFKHLAEIGVSGDTVPLVIRQLVDPGIEHVGIDITESTDTDSLHSGEGGHM